MRNITPKQKRNPWRNTRKDYDMPWNDILASILMLILPLVILFASTNIVMRVGTFYSYYFGKSNIIAEIPYEITNENLQDTFTKYMQHKTSTFELKEKGTYSPQQVFTERDASIMQTVRKSMDVVFILGVLLILASMVIIVYLCKMKERDIIYESFKKSHIWLGVLLILHSVIVFIPRIRTVLFDAMFGVRFDNDDVIVTLIDEGQMTNYYGVAVILIALLMLLVINWAIYKFIKHKRIFYRE